MMQSVPDPSFRNQNQKELYFQVCSHTPKGFVLVFGASGTESTNIVQTYIKLR